MIFYFPHIQSLLASNDADINDISDALFQLGHENEIQNNNLDIDFTPNRGDCLSLYGVVRDLNPIHPSKININFYKNDIPSFKFEFKNKLEDFCPSVSFLKLKIKSNKIDYQPYLEEYFSKLKIKKNNFFTDISNYLMYELGQPTHCYDFKVVKNGLSLQRLDQSTVFTSVISEDLNLEKNEIVFKHDNKISNFAGLMGSESSGCNEDTLEVLIECAEFNPDFIIGKSVKYDIKSDAAYRFERGVDRELHDLVLRRFVQIVQDHTEIIEINKNSYHYSDKQIKSFIFDFAKVNQVLGTDMSELDMKSILKKLGFKFYDDFIQVPSWRGDINHINDVSEEIARIIGYDNIKSKRFKIENNINKSYFQNIENSIRTYLVSNGFNEIINNPFVEHNDNSVLIDNPLDSSRSSLRTTIYESLIKNLDYNEKRQKDSIKFFEISDIYHTNDPSLYKKKLSVIVSGRQGKGFKLFNKMLDVKYLESVFAKFNKDISKFIKEIDRSSLNSKKKEKIYVFEIPFDEILTNKLDIQNGHQSPASFNKFQPISEYPSITRDISISVKKKDKIGELIECMLNLELSNLKDSYIFDFYSNNDKNICKIGFRYTFQSNVKTLEEADIEENIINIFSFLENFEDIEIPGYKK
tara:strand:- start:2030 stop:3943 length:1914 start_codon:yes stop_codon:yes gene_type:complete